MGFSDWVFSYLVILRLGVQGGAPAFPSLAIAAKRKMDRYEHFPIHKYDLTIYLEKIVRNFAHYPRYTLGSELGKRAGDCPG